MDLARLKTLTLKVPITLFDDDSVNRDKKWMPKDWFGTAKYGIFGDGRKTTKMSPPDNLTPWIIVQSKGVTKKGIEKISRSVNSTHLFSYYFSSPGKIKYKR